MLRLKSALDDSIVLLCNQIAAAALEAPIRLRLDGNKEHASALMQLAKLAYDLVQTTPGNGVRSELLTQLRATLSLARIAIDSVYEHLDRFVVSVDVVFQVERTRLRIERVDQLLAVWAEPATPASYSALTSQLITANLQRNSVRALLAESYALLGRKVVAVSYTHLDVYKRQT